MQSILHLCLPPPPLFMSPNILNGSIKTSSLSSTFLTVFPLDIIGSSEQHFHSIGIKQWSIPRNKEDKKGHSWFQRQFSSKMAPHDYDFSYEIEFATAIAAAAFAIHSVEEADSESKNKLRDGTRASMSRVKTRKDDPSRPPESRQISSKEAEGEYATSARWAGSNQLERTTRRSPDAKTDAWEKSAMAKLVKRHEKVTSSIIAWEKEKKMKAKVDMERKKRELEQRKAINLQHYQNETARIDHIARRARAQLEDKRRKEESEVRERAKKRIRSKGKVPFGRCFCF